MASTSPATPSGSRLWAYLQLLRIPNVFTAMADVLAGFFITHNLGQHGPPWLFETQAWPLAPPWVWLLLLMASSACLYLAGMVLNDVFDVEVDFEERPERPIPSGRISLRAAKLLGGELLVVGAALGWTVSYLSGDSRAGVIATLLAVSVYLYDGLLKRTFVAPVIMGTCRFLNLLLGMSLVPVSFSTSYYAIAGAIGVYIVGVTWFARSEARESSREQLAGGTLTLGLGIALLAAVPTLLESDAGPLLPQPAILGSWYILVGVIGAVILRRCIAAVLQPSPARVQVAVKQCIFSLIVLDAAAVLPIRGVGPALIILTLLFPTMALGKLFRAT